MKRSQTWARLSRIMDEAKFEEETTMRTDRELREEEAATRIRSERRK